ncbi:MAG: CHASE2 domain-containing protein, partial [Cyanobacteria bacterium J06636_16]
MGQQLLLNLGPGDWQTGFLSITAQLWETNQQPMQCIGDLPPAPQLATQYQHWQQLYESLYNTHTSWRRAAADFEFDTTVPTNVSVHEFETLCRTLQTELNQWLRISTFTLIERLIRTHLRSQGIIQVMLTAHSKEVLRFPWRLWHLFEDYPNAELSLSLPTYSRSLKQTPSQSGETVKILAILGNDDDIDVATDRHILGQLPAAQVTLLAQPTLTDLQHHLWESRWDVLFFAGHSTSQGKGYLQVNARESLAIDQLKYALRRTIANGLQIAILNSCDGLGLAWELADLHLPQTIVMREPVPDAIAQQFLKGFLTAFSAGRSLYSSVREAREKLHGLTELGTCATWLPVIVQNPAESPPTWRGLMGNRSPLDTVIPTETAAFSTHDQRKVATWPLLCRNGASTVTVTAIVLSLRWLGFLQGAELWAYDTLMKWRPAETPDARLVVVTINEKDIQAQNSLERRGSLADVTLHQTLMKLASYEPRVIGLDLYRDFPASTPDLAAALSQPNVVSVCKSRDPIADETGIAPAPELAETQVGFSDFLEETDGILRRQLLTLTPDPT